MRRADLLSSLTTTSFRLPRPDNLRRRGRIFALSTAAVGVVALVAAGIGARDWIRERWYWFQFEGSDAERRLQWAEKLSEVGSPRAAPWLLEELLRDYAAELERQRQKLYRRTIYGTRPDLYFSERGRRMEECLLRIGKPAMPVLVKSLATNLPTNQNSDAFIVAYFTIEKLEPEIWSHARRVVPKCESPLVDTLAWYADDEAQPSDVRQAASEAVERIRLDTEWNRGTRRRINAPGGETDAGSAPR